EVPVQPLHVHRIQAIFLALQPVAGQLDCGDVAHYVVPRQRFPEREGGRRLGAQIGEHQSGDLEEWVAGDATPGPEIVLRVDGVLERLFYAGSVRVEFPAVVLTAQAVLLDHADGQVDAAVGTVAGDEPELAAPI